MKYIKPMIKIYFDRIKSKDSNAFLSLCLGRFLNEKASDLRIGKLPSGQPYLEGEKKLSFSLSHSEDMWVCACSLDRDVGIDVQSPRPFNPRLFDRICTEKELAELTDRSEQKFFELWTLKEAALKCIGTGLQYPMEKLEIDFQSKQIEVLENRPVIRTIFSEPPLKLSYKKLDLFSEAETHLVWAPSSTIPQIEAHRLT